MAVLPATDRPKALGQVEGFGLVILPSVTIGLRIGSTTTEFKPKKSPYTRSTAPLIVGRVCTK